MKAVAEFQAVDGDGHAAGAARLPHGRGRPGQRSRRRHPDRGRLGQAADGAPLQGSGVATRSSWSASARSGSRPPGRDRCGPPSPPSARRRCAATPATCRSCAGYDKAALDAYRADAKAHQSTEERRLGYVAFTRARTSSSVTSSVEPAQDAARAVGRPGRRPRGAWQSGASEPADWLDKPGRRTTSTRYAGDDRVPWPVDRASAAEAQRRLGRPRSWCARPTRAGRPTTTSTWSTAASVADGTRTSSGCWPRRAPSGADVAVPLPSSLSATALQRLRDDPDGFARDLPGRCRGRRRRQRGSAPASTPGSRPASASRAARPRRAAGPSRRRHRGRVRARRADRRRSRRARSPTGPRTRSRPRSRWCWPATSSAAGSTRSTPSPTTAVPGRRLEDEPARGADPFQLAVYRQAWAELTGVRSTRCTPAFHYVRTGHVVEPAALPDRAALEALVAD